jgi:hypothetical protein
MFSSAYCLFSCHGVDCDNIEGEIKNYITVFWDDYLNLKTFPRTLAASESGTSV